MTPRYTCVRIHNESFQGIANAFCENSDCCTLKRFMESSISNAKTKGPSLSTSSFIFCSCTELNVSFNKRCIGQFNVNHFIDNRCVIMSCVLYGRSQPNLFLPWKVGIVDIRLSLFVGSQLIRIQCTSTKPVNLSLFLRLPCQILQR